MTSKITWKLLNSRSNYSQIWSWQAIGWRYRETRSSFQPKYAPQIYTRKKKPIGKKHSKMHVFVPVWQFESNLAKSLKIACFCTNWTFWTKTCKNLQKCTFLHYFDILNQNLQNHLEMHVFALVWHSKPKGSNKLALLLKIKSFKSTYIICTSPYCDNELRNYLYHLEVLLQNDEYLNESYHFKFTPVKSIYIIQSDHIIRGGDVGEFRKIDRTHPLVTCQRTYIPSFKTIRQNFEILEFWGGSPPWVANGGKFRKTEKSIR